MKKDCTAKFLSRTPPDISIISSTVQPKAKVLPLRGGQTLISDTTSSAVVVCMLSFFEHVRPSWVATSHKVEHGDN